MNKRLLLIFGRVLFFFGACIGLTLAVIMIWNSVEAIHYYFDGANYAPFNGLQCPVMIAPAEKGAVTASFKNPTNKEINFLYRTEISGRVSPRRVEGQVTVPPHQTKSIRLTVDARDIDLGFFIFLKMNILPNSLHGSRQSLCGIMVINLFGLTGRQIPAVALSLSFLGMAVGLAIGQRTGTKEHQNTVRVMQALGVVVLLCLLAATLGWWLAGMAFVAITILLMLISVRLAID